MDLRIDRLAISTILNKGVFLSLVALLLWALCLGAGRERQRYIVQGQIRESVELYQLLERKLGLKVIGIVVPLKVVSVDAKGSLIEVVEQLSEQVGLSAALVGEDVLVFGRGVDADKEIKQLKERIIEHCLREGELIVKFINTLDSDDLKHLKQNWFVPFSALSERERKALATAFLHAIAEPTDEEIKSFAAINSWDQMKEDAYVSLLFFPVIGPLSMSGQPLVKPAKEALGDIWESLREPWGHETIGKWLAQGLKLTEGWQGEVKKGAWKSKRAEVEKIAHEVSARRLKQAIERLDLFVDSKLSMAITRPVTELKEVAEEAAVVMGKEVYVDTRFKTQKVYVTANRYPLILLLKGICQACLLSPRVFGEVLFLAPSPGLPLEPKDALEIRRVALEAKSAFWREHLGFLYPSAELLRHVGSVFPPEVIWRGGLFRWEELTDVQRKYVLSRFPEVDPLEMQNGYIVVQVGFALWFEGTTGFFMDSKGEVVINPVTGKPVTAGKGGGMLVF